MSDTVEAENVTTPARPRRKLHFTLRGLLITFTIIGLALANLLMILKLYEAETDVDARTRELRAEIERLRHIAGYPANPDPDRVQVVAIPTTHPDAWSWRVFVPAGGMLYFQYHMEDAPLDSLSVADEKSAEESWRVIGQGMSTIHAEWRESADGKPALQVSLRHADQSAQRTLVGTPDQFAWRASGQPFEEVVAGADRAETYVQGDRVELLRLRPLDGNTQNPAGNTPGMVIWLWPASGGMH